MASDSKICLFCHKIMSTNPIQEPQILRLLHLLIVVCRASSVGLDRHASADVPAQTVLCKTFFLYTCKVKLTSNYLYVFFPYLGVALMW